MASATIYQITLKEQVAQRWAEWFAPLVIQHQPNGQTWLVGPLRDQAELHGLLLKIRNLNLTLIAVKPLAPDGISAPDRTEC